jgi:diguanylate cyclase (GGDEF)-like protein
MPHSDAQQYFDMPDSLWTRTAPAQADVWRFTNADRGLTDLDHVLENIRRSFGVRIATIRTVDCDDVNVVAGGEPSFPEREAAFCLRTLHAGRPIVIPDARRDDHFRADPLVSGEPHVRFYAGTPLLCDAGQPIGALGLFDTRPRRLSPGQVHRLAALASTVTQTILRQRDAATVAGLRAELKAKDALIREQAASLAHSRKIFDRASEAASIGVWECELPNETLHWTDVVYDIFELPRGSALDRNQILTFYRENSLKELARLRSQAIAERGSFTLDAKIVTAKGRQRWMRITATVECESGVPVRIFGMKQDITEEKLLWERTRYLADFDVMTGLANRGRFQARLTELDKRPPDRGPIGALALVDLDGFKQINDTYGHPHGDEGLKETARRLSNVCRGADLVARIGGDEFAVLLGNNFDQSALEGLAQKIVEAVSRPVDSGGQLLNFGASVGIACADGCTSEELFTRADTALYAAKAAGRNTFRTFSLSK